MQATRTAGPLLPASIGEAAALLRAGRTTSVALTEAAIARILALDPDLGSFLAVYEEQALAAAAAVDRERERGVDRGPLHGIPVAVKDVIACREGPTTGQSRVHDPRWWQGRDAPVVERIRAAGVVVVGKTTTMEHACGTPDPADPFPLPRNPWDTSRWAGGSSSGSASAVAAGLALAALGTDSGGSIRFPAAVCGVTGFKPTFGTISRRGTLPLSSSMDTVGVLARAAADCRLLLDAALGEAGEPTSADGARVALVRTAGLADETAARADAILRVAADALADQIVAGPVELPSHLALNAAATVTMVAEAWAHHLPQLRTRWHDYGRAARAYLGQGALLTAADYLDALAAGRVGRRAVARLFEHADVLVMPTTLAPVPPVEAVTWHELTLLFTRVWNLLGNPAISLPAGLGPDGLPLGLQLVGRPGGDRLLLAVAERFQERTAFHTLRPGGDR